MLTMSFGARDSFSSFDLLTPPNILTSATRHHTLYKKAIRLYMQTSQRFYMGKNVKVLLYLANAYYLVGQPEVSSLSTVVLSLSMIAACAESLRVVFLAHALPLRLSGLISTWSLPSRRARPRTRGASLSSATISPQARALLSASAFFHSAPPVRRDLCCQAPRKRGKPQDARAGLAHQARRR